ncbi:MAG: zinc-dependent metalloprotease [Limnohabitans sp.]
MARIASQSNCFKYALLNAIFLSLWIGSPVLAQSPAAPATPPANGAAPAVAPATPPSAPGALRPMKDILKDAKSTPGFFTLHQKDDKIWLEILPSQLGKPFFFSFNVPRSVGERGLYGSQMGGSKIVEFQKVGNQVQLIAKNTQFFAKEGTPQAQFVAESFSDSLMSSAAVVSAPNPETKSILIEANALLFSDIPGYQTRLEYAFRMPFSLDIRNTSFSSSKNTSSMTGLEVRVHFAVPRLSAPPMTPSPLPAPPPPSATADPRSMFVSFYYSMMPLPEPMAPRLADERVGFFTVARTDLTSDAKIKSKTHYLKRWRLEKKDPNLAVSEPKEPIVYWLDKNIPVKYRATVAEGVLEWNKAFEKAGFKNALVVKQQQDNDDFNNMDARHASIRWFTGADVGFAIGPSHADPRTGEILDADIGMSDGFTRSARRWVVDDLARPRGHDGEMCEEAEASAKELNYALDLLEARGVELDGPEAEALAKAYLKRTIMHEVGHTIGLRHNFRASLLNDLKKMHDAEHTKIHGITASVMDYSPFNIALKGEKQGEYVMSTLGVYDYWAVEFGYRQFPSGQESEGLAQILAKSTQPELQFDTDEDAGYGTVSGIDPLVNRFDLGSDPLAYYKLRMKLSRELWERLQNMNLATGYSYERLTRSFRSGFAQVTNVAPLASKYIGGVYTSRVRAGASKPLFEPVAAAKQREALSLITKDFFGVDSFKFKPEFIARLATDRLERIDNPSNLQTSVASLVANVQKGILDHVYSPSVANRLAEVSMKVNDPKETLGLADVYDTLQDAIWSEAKTGQETNLIRRNLQREQLRRMTDVLVKPAGPWPADARSIMRENARQLVALLEKAIAKPGLSKTTKAHYADALDSLNATLKASMQRAAP